VKLITPIIAAIAGALALAGCGDDEPPRRAAPSSDAALIAAAEAGDLGRVEQLLERGANVRARDRGGRTALIAAAFGNHVDVARVLIAAGADVNAKDDTIQSPYLIATSEVGDDPRLLELTLDHGAKVDDKDSYNGTGLIRAAERGFPRIVRRLLDAGIDSDHVNRLGWTALHEAIVLGEGGRPHVATVRTLIEGGVDVNIPDGDGERALALAEERGHRAIANLLLEAGARR
jgi:ankyrin repeat protein